MIKPIGSDVLQPLFVYDTDEHQELRHEAENHAICDRQFTGGRQRRNDGGIL